MSRDRILAPNLNAASTPYPKRDALNTAGQTKYLNMRNFNNFPKREKKIPPDANGAASKCKLYQFAECVQYRCSRCRRDGILDDCLAADTVSGEMMCVSCFSKVIKPQLFKPTRVVPFPSLLSWLNYKPAAVQTEISSDVRSRPVEAVLPSGHRIQHELIGNAPSMPVSVADLSNSALNPLGNRLDDASRCQLQQGGSMSSTAEAALLVQSTHPCATLFGRCAHGGVCFFKNAPSDFCLLHLMRLCDGHGNLPDGSGCGKTQHDAVFDLPGGVPPRPPRSDAAAWDAWLRQRKGSQNQAEWQLWHQPGVQQILDKYLPETADAEATSSIAPAPTTVNVTALKDLLHSLKK